MIIKIYLILLYNILNYYTMEAHAHPLEIPNFAEKILTELAEIKQRLDKNTPTIANLVGVLEKSYLCE